MASGNRSSSGDDFDAFVDDVLSGKDSTETQASPSDVRPDPVPTAYAKIFLSTTSEIHGRPVAESCGLVSGHCVTGQGLWKNVKMALSDSFGKRSQTMENELQRMQQECFRQLKVAAHQKGCDAVVGVSIRFGEVSGEADMFYATAIGTAVKTAAS